MSERGSWYLINVCRAYKYLRIITQLTFIMAILNWSWSSILQENILSSGVLDSWNTLNIYNSLCLNYCCIAWWAKRQLFEIMMGRSFCHKRKHVFMVLKFTKTFDISTTKHHSIKGNNKIKIIRRGQCRRPELNCGKQSCFVNVFLAGKSQGGDIGLWFKRKYSWAH